MRSTIALFILGMAIGFLALALAASAHAQPAPPVIVHRAPPVIVHHSQPPPPRVVYVERPREEWGLGSWLAAPFNAIGTGVGTVAAGVGNIVEAPFIAVGQAWGENNCWREMVDRRTGESKLMWICR